MNTVLSEKEIHQISNCKKYKVTFTLDPRGKFRISGDFIEKNNNRTYGYCVCFIPRNWDWNEKRVSRKVEVLA